MSLPRVFPLVLLLLVVADVVSCEDVFVTVREGTLRGKTVDFSNSVADVSATINVFKGIPYAEKPVRFNPPVEKTPWPGVFDATEFGSSCPQMLTPDLTGGITYVTDEDCLALNVYAPNQTDSRLPVMVFIHGGGYTTGSSMTPSFEGVPLAAIGHVVLVTINYRVGVHGFLCTADQVSPGNYGLFDQALALKWVRLNIEGKEQLVGSTAASVTLVQALIDKKQVILNNAYKVQNEVIHFASRFTPSSPLTVDGVAIPPVEKACNLQGVVTAFGGNSSMVTIFGESAGASSVDMHVVYEYSHALFDQAITQSGQAVALWNIREEFEKSKRENAFRLGSLLNCTTTDSTELIRCLSQVDSMLVEATAVGNGIQMGPTIDGVFIDDYPLELTKAGKFKHCPMMLGFNRDEGTVNILFDLPGHFYDKDPPFVNEEEFDKLVTSSLLTISGYTSDLMEESVKHEYVDWSQADDPAYNYLPAATNVYGDDEFSCPAILTARAHATMTSDPIYLYQFSHVPEWSIFEVGGVGPGWLGASHAEEIPFVFGYGFIPGLDGLYGPMTEEEKHLSVKLVKHWANFARNGDPSIPASDNTNDLGERLWPQFSVPELQYMDLNMESYTSRGLKADECAFWNDFKLQIQSYLASMDESELEWREEYDGWKDDLEKWRISFGEYQGDPQCPA